MYTRLKVFVGDEKVYNHNSVKLDNSFQPTVLRLLLDDLEITDIKKIQGSIFNPLWVRGVIDLSKPMCLVPLFIDEDDVVKLQKEIFVNSLTLEPM